MKRFLFVIALLFVTRSVSAQTPTLQWTAPDNTVSASEAAGLTYTLYVNAGPAVAVPGAVCVVAAPGFACSAPVPAGTPTTIGTKLELTARSGTGVESPRSIPFTSAPTAPTNFRRQ